MPDQKLIEAIDEYDDDVGYFLKIFFISDKMNGNIWKVAKNSIEDGLKTGLEKRYFEKTAPIIMREDWEQAPKLGHPSPYVADMIKEQEPDRKGHFVAVGSKDGDRKTGWVIVKITDRQTEMDHRAGKIKFVSPSIESIRENELGEDVIWRINHLAFVTDPAYGYEAQVTGACYGKPGECVVHLAKQANSCRMQITLPRRKDVKLTTRQALRQITLPRRNQISLKSASDNDNDNDEEKGRWITVKGTSVFIPDGEDQNDVVEKFLKDKEKKTTKKDVKQQLDKTKRKKYGETTSVDPSEVIEFMLSQNEKSTLKVLIKTHLESGDESNIRKPDSISAEDWDEINETLFYESSENPGSLKKILEEL